MMAYFGMCEFVVCFLFFFSNDSTFYSVSICYALVRCKDQLEFQAITMIESI